MLKNSVRLFPKEFSVNEIFCRNVATKKRFYKSCNVIAGNDKFEITLDHRKLKTPNGNVVAVESEPLALAIAAEWNAQKEKIVQSNMHLTGLCFTAIDNPDRLTKEKIASELVSYLENDTILYYANEDEEDELHKRQVSEWLPVCEWLSQRYHVQIQPSAKIEGPTVTDDDKNKIEKYFLSYNFWALLGFRFSIEALKSVILGLASADRFLTVEHATALSRLEEDYQSRRWGRVEWAHDLNEYGTRARVAAGTLFIHANSSIYLSRTKRSAG